MRLARTLTLTLTLITLVLAVSALAADISGKWKATTQGPDGNGMELTMTFKVDGNKLTGTVSSQMGDMPITDGKVDGANITFTVEAMDQKIVHTGTVSGDEIKIKVDFGGQAMEMTAKRM